MPRRSTDRVADLLARMTIEEKLAQLGSAWVFQLATASGFDAERAAPVLADGIGHVTRVCGASGFTAAEAAAFNNELQRHLLEHTRLGIPAIVHEEICAGLMAREATVFPQAIGVAATFRPDLNAELADAVRLQMRAIGAHHGLSPVLDLCRDPRWGRLEETYGEDPHLVTQMGLAYIRGLQGDDLTDGVVATAKHFVGYGASEGGFNWAPAHLNERELRDVYLRPFEAAVRFGAAGLGDERLSRDRRRAVRRQPRGCSTSSCAASGDSTAPSCPTTSRSVSSRTTTTSPHQAARRRPWR